jgi:superfamily I DNA/RNA helicase
MVLCRTQEEVNELTDMLKSYKIPVNRVKTMFDSYEADSIMGYAAAAMNRDFGWKKVASNPVQSITEATKRMAIQAKDRVGLDKFMSAWKSTHFQIDPTAEERYNEIMGHFTKGLEDFFAMLWARRMPKNNCRVMTIHASKGLEADNVIIYNVNEGRIPHRMESNVDAERRLLYVGMTRAREALTLHVGPGRTRSRFLQEIG